MANDLTGDYDVAVQLSLDAVNRVTAALHSVKRFPHSLSMAVDDRPNRTLSTVVVGVVDLKGSAVVNPKVIENGALASVGSGGGVLTQDVLDNLDPVVNIGGLVNPVPGPLDSEYSYVYGEAQAQLGAPTMKLPKNHSDQAEIHTPAMIRYFANTSDPKTNSLSPFLRGEIVTTFAVKSVTSKAGANIVVDLAGPSGNVHFNSAWSEAALDANDKKAIDLALSKVLKHGFQPSSTPRPDNVLAMDFRGYPSDSAIGMLMNVTTKNNPSPDSVRNVFLHSDDQFALALNGDVFTDQFSSAVNSAIDPLRVENIDTTVTINYWIGSYTFHIYTRITVGTATVQLTDTLNPAGIPGRGQIVLTIPVSVNFGWEGKPFFVSDPTDFGFTIVQAFTLTLDGTKVGLQTVGAVQINIPGSVPSDESDQARTRATTLFNNLWNTEKSRINQQVNGALSAGGLQSFLHSLMNPAGSKGAKVDADLAYTSFEINRSGIVLHGGLSVPPWPSAHIDFANDPSLPPGKHGYQALNSWIPGGTIQQYVWTFGMQAVNDSNRFVVQNAPLFTFSTCLTLTGQRISASGPVFYEPVIAGLCKTQSAVSAKLPPGAALASVQRPLVALVPPAAAPASGLEVVGHISPWSPKNSARPRQMWWFIFPTAAPLRNWMFCRARWFKAGAPIPLRRFWPYSPGTSFRSPNRWMA